MIVSFYNDKVNPDVVKYQKKVFQHFGLNIHQIFMEGTNGATSHAEAIDAYLNTGFDFIQLFDIDCIPLNRDHMIPCAGDNIYSVAQKASHIEGSIIYASPAFICFSRNVYEKLGRPSFLPTSRADCGAELTYAAREKGIEVRLLYPSHVEEPLWNLDGSIMFGEGTTYGNSIYHAFHAQYKSERFIDKCKQILGE